MVMTSAVPAESGHDWLDEDEAAVWLRVPVTDLQAALDAGQLPGVRIGSAWRLRRDALIAAAGRASTPVLSVGRVTDPLPRPRGLIWVTADFKRLPGYSYRFGSGGTEDYSEALAGQVAIFSDVVDVIVGTSAGPRADGRRRRVVFFNNYVMYEFIETPEQTRWAAIIRPDGSHYAAQPADLPPLYHAAPVEPYRTATGLTGRGRSTGLALVLRDDDLRSAVHHAAAKWLANRGHEVVAAET